MLTNSAVSLRVLGTLNGVATSVSALGRAAGPAIGGSTFSWGVDVGYVVVPWWTLAVLAALGAVPVWWLVEMEGFGGEADAGNEESENGSEDEDGEDENTVPNMDDESVPTSPTTPISRHNSNTTPIPYHHSTKDSPHDDFNPPLDQTANTTPSPSLLQQQTPTPPNTKSILNPDEESRLIHASKTTGAEVEPQTTLPR